MQYVNKVCLRGMLSKFQTLPSGRVVVTVNTLNATAKPNYPKVVFSSKNAKEIMASYKCGDYITIEGKIVTNRKLREDGNVSVRQYIYGYKICKTPCASEETLGVKMGRPEPPKNVVSIAGNVVYVKKVTDDLVNIIIGVKEENDFITRIKVCYFPYKTKKISMTQFLSLIYEGAEIRVTGTYQTSQKTTAKTQYNICYENIVVDDIDFEDKPYEETKAADIDIEGCEEV